MPGSESAHTLEITLAGIDPPVSRTVRVPSTTTLGQLHEVIQIAMGWDDNHLHEFEIDGAIYGVDDGESDDEILEEEDFTLRDLTPSGTSFRYTYDFGDDWNHVVTVADVSPTHEAGPVCLVADRACPPEDCGGGRGYAELLAGGFDPEPIDLAEINRRLLE